MKVVVGTVIKDNNKLLMVRERQDGCHGKWNFPTGKLEEKEDIIEGAIRETLEETGYLVKVNGLFPIEQIITEKNNMVIRFTFLAEVVEQTSVPDPREILEIKWMTKDQIKDLKNSEMRGNRTNREIMNMLEENELFPLSLITEVMN